MKGAVEGYAVGEQIPNSGTFVPGTYRVKFVEDQTIISLCNQMLEEIDVTNLIPDSVLISWYVKSGPESVGSPPEVVEALVMRVIDGVA